MFAYLRRTESNSAKAQLLPNVANAWEKFSGSLTEQDTLGHILPLADTFCFHEDAFSLALGPAALRGSGIELNSPARIANSDRSKASYTLLGGVLRFCHHRVCEEHFLRNAVHHCGALDDHGKTQFRGCFRALTSSSFEQNWQELQRCHPKHAAYLDQEPRQNWASYTFVERGLSSFGVVNNNFAESHASRLLHGSEHVRGERLNGMIMGLTHERLSR